MICEKYDALSVTEKVILVGRLTHIIQSSNDYFDKAKELISQAEFEGIFDGVTILPTREIINHD